MNWFTRLLRIKPKNTKMAPTSNGTIPWFTESGNYMYESDVVKQALKCIVDELKKLNPMHIRVENGDPSPVKGSSLQRVLRSPNEFMTTSEMIEKSAWLLLLNENAFIIPVYEEKIDSEGEVVRDFKALYPINPMNVVFEEADDGKIYVEFWFANGYRTTIPYSDVIHWKTNYSVNDYMGGNFNGQPDNVALNETLQLNRELLKGIAKAMKASYSVTGVVKYSAYMDEAKQKEAQKEFERKLQNADSGILPLDLKSEYIPLEHKSALVDDKTLQFIDEKILRNWGVPINILKGDYSQDTYNSFYQKCLEPLIITLSQAFTKKLFTPRELSFGNKVDFYAKDLIFLSIPQKLEMINILAPTGGLFENEKRVALGLRPLPELVGKRFMSLNWIDANNADQYQVGKVNYDVVSENKTENLTETEV